MNLITLIEVLMDAGGLANLYKLQVLTFFHSGKDLNQASI